MDKFDELMKRIDIPNKSINLMDLNELVGYAQLGKQMQWVSVKDGLPDKNPFLAYVPSQTWSPIVMCAYDTKYRENPFSNWVTEEELFPTHWMPLPPSPKEEV